MNATGPAPLSPMLREALTLAVEYGLAVFPLRGKAPAIPKGEGGRGFLDASTSPDKIAEMFARRDVTGYGVVPGSGRLLGIDVDNPDDEQFLAGYGAFSEPTWVVQSGRADGMGKHPWFRMPSDIPEIPNLNLLGSDGCKVRCTGGYLVGPGSVHPDTGNVYKTIQGGPDEVATLPPALEALIRAKLNGNGTPTPAPTLPDTICAGEGRDNAMTSLAGSMRRRGASPAAILAAITEDNATRCRPPLPARDLERIAGSIGAKPVSSAAPHSSQDPAPAPFGVVRVLAGAAPEPPREQVHGLLVDRDVNIWGGYGGAAKSILALLVAIGVALGREVFGTLRVNRSGRVLLVCPEDGQAALRMMLDALIEGIGLSLIDRETLEDRLVMIADDEFVDLTTDTRRLCRTAKALEVVLVVLDPLRNLLGGADENDNGVAGAVMDMLRRDLCRDAGAAVLILLHLRKPGREALTGASVTVHDLRGGGGWAAGARLAFHVAKNAERITLSALKANRLRADLRHELLLAIDADPENAAHWRSCTVTDANAGAHSEGFTPGMGRELNANELAALSCLDDQHEPDKRVSPSAWLAGSGLNPNTHKTIKDRLLKADLAKALPTGKKARTGGIEYAYQITPQGRRALRSGWADDRSTGEGVSNG